MTEARLPFSTRITTILLGLTLVCVILYVGKDVLIPIAFAAIFAVVLYPVSRFLEQHRVPRVLAITIAIVLACSILFGVATFIAMQIGQFSEDVPRLREQGTRYFTDLQAYIHETFGFTYPQQLRWLRQGAEAALTGENGMLNQTLLTFVDITTLVVLAPLYAFLFLYYKELLVEFFIRVFSHGSSTVREVLSEIRLVIKSYIVGLLFETIIIAVLNSIALLLLGVEYAILFGVIAAVLNLIPYVGILIGAILPTVMALITTNSIWPPLGVIGAFTFIQFLDNNFIVPYVVGSRISINAIISIIAVVVGGALWGISGMFLSLPAVAIMKVIFDRVDSLKPWGMLFGDEIPGKRRTKTAKA